MKNKKLIEELHKELAFLTIEDVQFSVDAIIEFLGNSLSQEKRIEIRNFGSFAIHYRNQIKDNKEVQTPFTYFRASKHLKNTINNKNKS